MSEVTQILSQMHQGDPTSAEKLLPLVYEELRKLAALRLANEKSGQTLQPTALVHEAYIRLVDQNESQAWNSRGHFFAAAVEAMRRILVENARHRKSARAGGDMAREPLSSHELAAAIEDDRLLALNEALTILKEERPQVGQLVELRYFGGLTIDEAAATLEISKRSANRYWVYAKAWLTQKLQ